MPDPIRLVGQCNRYYLPVLYQPQLIYLLTEFIPGIDASWVNPPLNLTLVLDRSGSMAGEKLRKVKEAINNLIDQLCPSDIISIVTFETTSRVVVPAQPAVNKADIKRQIDQIDDGGGTNLIPGLRNALDQVTIWSGTNYTSRIMLLTDGEPIDSQAGALTIADQAGELRVPIIGLGLGEDWNHDFILELADRSILAAPGSHTGLVYYIPGLGSLNEIFKEVLDSMQICAQNVAINLRIAQGVEIQRAWQVEPVIRAIGNLTSQERRVTLSIGDVGKAGVGYLFEVLVPSRPTNIVRVAQIETSFNRPGSEQQQKSVDVIVSYTLDEERTRQPWNEQVKRFVAKVQAFKLQTQALEDAEIGNVQGSTQKLREAVTILLSQGDTELAQQMQQEANRLQQSGQISNKGKKTISLISRKTVRLSD